MQPHKLSQSQKLSLTQTLSPLQIQFIRLLQLPVTELEKRIDEELEANPALEENTEYEEYSSSNEMLLDENDNFSESSEHEDSDKELSNNTSTNEDEEISCSDFYINADELSGYKMQGDGNYSEEDKEFPIPYQTSLTDRLLEQLGFLSLNEKQHKIGVHIIGSLDSDGYLRRPLQSIVNDLLLSSYIETNEKEVKSVLEKIQRFDPPGIAAQTLQECLLLQLYRMPQNKPEIQLAIQILENSFEDFSKKHYAKILKKFHITQEQLLAALKVIKRLNPKPGDASSSLQVQETLIPDFQVREVNGKIEVHLDARNAPELRISKSYTEMAEAYEKRSKKDKSSREALRFVKQKIDSAKWFIDALRERQRTLLKTMEAIVNHQYQFFMTGDETKLKPMVLKDIAKEIGMDISTVSRVANSKYVQTDFGIYPLKYFFSESVSHEEGEDVSSREVKSVMKEIIAQEDKTRPLSDDELVEKLQEKGYNIARRTVAKYREQLDIPVARLRKEIQAKMM
ncbi:MAG: RNA polymerase factor sigma-54 [Cytophagales bacterium]|nr:RNA polymerase factor sigma-54 [Cytophagales bacterium]MDW8384783.1 RNA polymerase factor sigma-54 [Flammeovirgaceae bacterium]